MPTNPVRSAATRAVDAGLEYVTLDGSAIDGTAAALADAELALPDWRHPALPDEREVGPATVLDYFLVANALNFQFHRWSDDRVYAATVDGNRYTGAFAMWGSVRRALERDIPLTDGAYLASLDAETTTEIFAGDPPMPFLEDRLAVLRHLGERLQATTPGRFHQALPTEEPIRPFDDGSGLVEWLARTFPAGYGDTRALDGRTIPFLKKAQLAVALLAGRFAEHDRYAVAGLDDLTLFADYVIPAILRAEGVLEYDDALAARVDEGEPLPANSRMEVEIRAATVVAGDRLLDRLAREHGRETTAVHLDHALWQRGRGLTLPFHHTATRAY